jgi:CubicO group peptidase (beta-lactamase class C family)
MACEKPSPPSDRSYDAEENENTTMLDEKQLQDILNDVQKRTHVPAIGAALCHPGGEVVAAVGLSSTATGAALSTISQFDLSCLMKFFVSITALESADAGRLDLNASIASILPEFSEATDDRGNLITVRHLLGHRSGYRGMDITDPRVRWNCNWRDIVLWASEAPLLFEPGHTFSYEHSEHVILSRLLDRVVNRQGLQLVHEMLFEPLNITPGHCSMGKTTNPHYAENHILSPATGKYMPISIPPFCSIWGSSLPNLTMSLSDIAKIAYLLVPPPVSYAQINLSDFTRRMVSSDHVMLQKCVSSNLQAERTPKSFGLLCGNYGAGIFGHNGSSVGQTCAVRVVPSQHKSLVVGTNAWSPYARDLAIQYILAETAENQQIYVTNDVPEQFTTVALFNDVDPAQVPGRYLGGYNGEVTVRRKGEDLVCEIGNDRKGQKKFCIKKKDENEYTIISPSPVSAGFFSMGRHGEPALFLGVHGYVRVQKLGE